MMGKLEEIANKSTVHKVGGAVLSGIGVIDGARRVISGAQRDENGDRHLGKVAVGVAELVAGGAIGVALFRGQAAKGAQVQM